MLANAGNQLMSLTDAVMVGRLGAASLAGVGIGNGIYFSASIFGIGLVMGMDAPVSQAIGAGDYEAYGREMALVQRALDRLAALTGE